MYIYFTFYVCNGEGLFDNSSYSILEPPLNLGLS